jgi:hypothetical protein
MHKLLRHKPVQYLLGFLIACTFLACFSIALFMLMPDLPGEYTIGLEISNEKQEKWLLVFLPFIGEEMQRPFKIDLPPLKQIIVEEDSYRQYMIVTGALKHDGVDLRFRRRMPYDKFFLLVVGWKIDPSVISVDLEDLAFYFDSEPDYQKFLFNPNIYRKSGIG